MQLNGFDTCPFCAVKEFMDTMSQKVPEEIGFPDDETQFMRERLIQEEVSETLRAVACDDLPGYIDGCIDTIYVAIGAILACGVDPHSVFEAVHTANMKKAGGPVREDGKQMRPEGWSPPDMAGELRRQGWEQ